MSQQKYRRLWSQIFDVLTYFSFPSLGPFTRDRQKNKIREGTWQECLLLSLSQSNFLYPWCIHSESRSLKSRCTTCTTSYTSIWHLSRFGLLTVKSYFTHLVLASECLNTTQVLLNSNDSAFGVVKPLVYGGSKDMAENKMDIQREDGMKSFFMVPQLLLISESAQIHLLLPDISFDQWAAPFSPSLPLNIVERLSVNVSICRRETEKVNESGAGIG